MGRMREEERGGVMAMGRAEIDARAPFISVKEAVMLFGEKVLLGEIYAHKLKEKRVEASDIGKAPTKVQALEAELEEAKQTLQKAREENSILSQRMKTLREELKHAKKELTGIKAREFQKQRVHKPDSEDLKFIEKPSHKPAEIKIIKTHADQEDEEESDEDGYFQKKRYVKFASPPSLTKVIVSKEDMLQRPPSVKKTKKIKPLIPFIGWLFSRKKGNQEDESLMGNY